MDKRGYEIYSLLQRYSPIALCLTLVRREFQLHLVSLQLLTTPTTLVQNYQCMRHRSSGAS